MKDDFIEDIKNCLKNKGYTMDDLLNDRILKDADERHYKTKDEQLIHDFLKVLNAGNIRNLLTFTYHHQENIDLFNFNNRVLFEIYSYNHKNNIAIDSYTIQVNEQEGKIFKTYEILMHMSK